ncbi:amino acid adenylation domain-containing protein, partial [Paenibacillus cisolokensis]|uniref:amino acid adenylation domain-containing protein n=1 Tax=Paenibacillus cisolokensis TaxID=1658519 RepID=UPI003D2AE2EE
MEARNFVVDRLTNMIATIARIDPGSIDPDQNLIELGADSIILTDVNSFIREEFGVEIPLTMFFEQLTSVSEIADYIYPQLTAWSFSPSPASASNAADRVAVRQEEAAMMQSAVTGNSDMPEAASALPVTSPLLRLESAHPAASQLPRLESADTGITQLLVQQLEIMNNQLRLLSGNQAAAAAEPAVARTVAVETPRPGVAEEVKTASVLQPSLQQSPVRNGLEQTTSASAGTSDSQPYVPYKPLDLARKQADEQQKQHIEALMKSYTAKTKKSKAFAASYHLPYADWRNISGFRPAIKEMVYQLVFQYSQGAYITDIDGNQYIDLTMDFGASLFGHNVDFIKEAIQEEMTKGFPLSLITDLSGEVAKLICEMTGVERVSFFNSGTEAVMVAMRLARAATGKNKIVIFSGAYHGTFDGVLGMNMSKDQGGASPIAGGILQSYVDDLYVLNYDDPKSLTFIAEHAHEIAAVMAEPVQSRRPDLVPREFLQQVRALTEQRNMLLIFDEMILGFRLGKGGAQEFFGVEADLVTYGKIVGGGMPIGIVSGKQKVMDCLDGGVWQYGDDSVPPYEDKRTFAGGTFCHHPLAMAAAKAVLLKIKAEADTIYPQINRRTQYLAEELNRFFRENEVPAKIVYCGSLFRFVLKGNMEMFYYHLLDQGVYIWEGRNCFLSVSHTDEDIDRIIQVVQDVCLKMKGVFFARNTGGGNESNGSSIKKKQIELTLEQQRMLVSEMMNPGTSAFNQSILLHITGQLDHSALNAAAHKVISRHEALRCTFSSDRTKLMPHEEVEFEIATVPVHQDTEHEITAGLIRAPFDYDRGPLIRLYLLKDEQEPASRKLLITAHHFVADGWSLSVFCEELMEAYNSSLADIAPQFSEVVRYSDYLQQREAELAQLDTQEIVQFWRSQLADCDSELALPRHEIMAASDEGKGARLTYTTDDKWIVKVRKAAAAVKCSPFMVLLTAYQVMLSELTGQRQFAVGVPFAGQASVSPKALIGNCVTILPVTVQLGASSILSHLARKNQEQFKAFDAIRYFPIEAVTEPGDERLPKLNMMFNMDRMPQKKEFAGTTVEMLPVETDSSMYDLFFNVIEFNGSMVFDIDFNTGLYSRQTVHRWLELYLDIIDQFCHQPEMHLYDLQTFRPEDEDIAMEAMKQADLIQLQQDTGIRLADFIRTDEPVYGLIMNKESRPVLTNQYGVLYLGPSRAELYHTGWMARFTNESRLELLGPEKCCYVRDGKFISLWLIERALKACPDVLAATVYIHEATGELTADIHPAVEGLTANRWLDWCLKKMPVAMIPKRFYETNGEANAEKVLFEYHKEAVSEAEESVYEIIGDLVGLQAFGKHENLISLGMSSLQLIKLLSALQAKYNVRIPVTMLAKAPTVSGVAAAIDQLRGTGHDHMPLMPRAEAGLPYYKTSSAQKRMYVLHELQEDKLNYNMPSVVKIEGQFEIETFKAAVYACIQRHENLRTSFHELDGEIVQKIHETSFISIEVLDRTDVENEQQLMTFIKEQLVAPFQLDQPLMRACIIRYGEHAYMAFFDFHHIIFDGASAAVFAREVMALYHQAQLPPLSCQYKDYVLWLNSFQDSERMAAQENSWREWLPHRPQTDYVALDHLRPAIRTYAGQLVKLDLDPELKSMIDRLCREHGTTPYVFFLTALNVLLSMYSMEQEIVIGTLVEGRNHHEVHDLIGMFVNTLPIVTQVDQEQSFQAFMKGMQQRVLNVFASSDVPFERIVELSGRAIEQGRNPLFDILFSYQGFEPLQLQSGDTLFEYMELPTEDCKFDIEFEVVDQTSHYQLIVHYAAELYEPATIHRLIDHFMTLIASILSNADQPLSRLEMLTPDERSQILTEFNRSDTVFPDDQTVVTAFEEWVRQTPDQTAILFEQEKVTYRQFNAEANQLARFLLEQGMQEDNIAGIMLYRSPAMIQGIMGIWKAGGAYLPLDVEHPVRRRLEVLHEAGAKWVLTLSEYVEEEFRAGYEGTILCLDELAEHIGSYSQDNLEHKPSPAQLAYSLFTSGSTGKPKGVMIEHAGMLNHIWAERDLLGLGADMVFAQNANHCFDISVWQLTGALALGGTTAIYSNELVLEPQRFVDRMIEDGVTLLEVVPSYLTVMMDDAETREVKHPHLRHLIITGEAVKPHLLKRWFALYPDVPVVNAYGPAEASDDISQYVISRMPDAMETVPIGRPLNNVRIYILDPQGRLCPVGHVGEICVAGLCVGRGYVNQPEKTAQVFVEDPYALAEDIPRNKRMYRTGDLGKWLPDGNIEYLGRMDEQVKIRGYRIELGEIESVLRKQAGVRDAAVIAREDAQGDKYLCAYVVPQAAESAESFDREWSRNELRKELPDYMVPMYYVTLEQLPVTSNGKLDRRALPEPERSSEAAMTPRNETEEQLVKIFQDVLGLDQVGIHDSFFELGGHSLRAVRAINLMETVTGVRLPLRTMFEHPTVAAISELLIGGTAPESYAPIPQAEQKDTYPMSSAQKRLFVIHQMDAQSTVYNMAGVLQMDGEVDLVRMNEAFQQLVDRHESLRTSFHIVDGEPVQRIHERVHVEVEFEIEEADSETKWQPVAVATEADTQHGSWSEKDGAGGDASGSVTEISDRNAARADQHLAAFVRPFELSQAPLIRLKVVEAASGSHLLLFDMHHIISDGASINVVTREFLQLYNGETLAPLPVHYKDYSEWMRTQDLNESKAYWEHQFSGELPVLDL